MKDTFTFYWDEFTLHDSSEPNQMWPNSDKCIQNEEQPPSFPTMMLIRKIPDA